jgi:tRNA A-37 threonylcarbamoyl transferase component Bud32
MTFVKPLVFAILLCAAAGLALFMIAVPVVHEYHAEPSGDAGEHVTGRMEDRTALYLDSPRGKPAEGARASPGEATSAGGGLPGPGRAIYIIAGLIFPAAVVFISTFLYSRTKASRLSRWRKRVIMRRRRERGRPWRPMVIGAMIGKCSVGNSGNQSELCPNCGADLPCNAPHGLCPKCLLQEALSAPDDATPPKSPATTGPYAGTGAIPSAAELGQYFPQLEIMGLLGQGGMGAVYKARQVKLDRLVALKILPPLAGQDPAFTERFMREARALARVSHPQIVAVHDFGEAGGMFYFLMEYVDGLNLRQLMQSGRLPPEQGLPIVGQICDALQFAHEEGIIHRDIKPENILLDQKGRVKIADFGLAKIVDPNPAKFTLTGSRQAMGTPHYMAPEQIERPQTVDQRADIYSLGVLIYEMLTGELPLGHFALPSQKAAVDERLDAIVLRALAKDPEQRYQRVSELKTDITGTGAVLAPASPPIAPAFSFNDQVDLEVQRFRVVGPGACLIATGIFSAVQLLGVMIFGIVMSFEDRIDIGGTAGAIALSLVGLTVIGVLSGILITGGRRMMNFESYSSAMLASILAIPASFPYVIFLGWPAAIWALIVLRKPEVRLAFARKAVHTRLSNPFVAPPTGPVRGRIRSMFGAFRSLVMGSRVDENSINR